MSIFVVRCADSRCCPVVLQAGFDREIFFHRPEADKVSKAMDRAGCGPHRVEPYVLEVHGADAIKKDAVKEERRRIRKALGDLRDQLREKVKGDDIDGGNVQKLFDTIFEAVGRQIFPQPPMAEKPKWEDPKKVLRKA